MQHYIWKCAGLLCAWISGLSTLAPIPIGSIVKSCNWFLNHGLAPVYLSDLLTPCAPVHAGQLVSWSAGQLLEQTERSLLLLWSAGTSFLFTLGRLHRFFKSRLKTDFYPLAFDSVSNLHFYFIVFHLLYLFLLYLLCLCCPALWWDVLFLK